MPACDRDYARELDAWRARFAGAEESMEATWELAGIEERLADALFDAATAGSAPHYHAALRALLPQGVTFTSAEENDRRMQAYHRITSRLYEIGPDGRPRHAPPVARTESAPRVRDRLSRIDLLHRDTDHWHLHRLGSLWFDAAQLLARDYPDPAGRACRWSLHYFERHHQAWSAHLPASRWDSDGGAEMAGVHEFAAALGVGDPDRRPPEWVRLLADGDWVSALDALGEQVPEEAWQPLALILADACQSGGRADAAARLLAAR